MECHISVFSLSGDLSLRCMLRALRMSSRYNCYVSKIEELRDYSLVKIVENNFFCFPSRSSSLFLEAFALTGVSIISKNGVFFIKARILEG